ncbi:thiamine pyrophosphate-binding protein [Amorphus sp. 3PC139-8]|uniref:thiamine pyrophosphate-binding protein n=1 Tax=Amorphus sp. 3PC139-8 TaxID=2735676 RepID=UPI00345C9B2A
MKVFEILARSLANAGQGPLFGLVGDANLYMIDSFLRDCGGRYYGAANESGAVLMALGHASVSGKVGIASVTHGPAVTNTLTALAEGVKASLPVVLMCGDTAYHDRENLQNIAQREAILSTGAGFDQVNAAETAADDLARAIRRAYGERRPIALNIPVDIQRREVEAEASTPLVSFSVPTITPTGDDLDNAIGLVAAAKRPIVLAGRGATDPASREALLRLAERLEAPLATTLKAKDLFRSEDFNLGVYGTLSTPKSVDAIMKSDCVIAFGASLGTYTTSDGGFVKGKRVVQVMAREEDIGLRHVPDVGLVGGMKETADLFVHWLDEAEIPPSGFRAELDPKGLADHPDPASGQQRSMGLDYVTALSRLDALLPADRIYVTDAGRHMVKALQYLNVNAPSDFVLTANFGSIGLGMGHANGAAAACPERTVVLTIGDGGFMLGGLAEFNTAVRYGLNLVVVLCNDGSYGAEHVQLRDKQMNPAVSLFEWPEFAPLAQALGGRGVQVRTLDDFDAVKSALAERDGPLLIELKLDPDHMPFY